MKAYRDDLFQHEIPLKSYAKSLRQNKMHINLTLPPKMKEEIIKMRDGFIIKPIRQFT